MYDIVLKNGLVIDPGNKIMGKLNLGIYGDKISCLTDSVIEGKTEYDCTGLVVTPGFIDIHAHEDKIEMNGLTKPVITALQLRGGTTTFVGSQCGVGPLDEDEYTGIYDTLGQPVNMVLLTGHGALREAAGVKDKYGPVTEAELTAMGADLRKRMTAGSHGITFGIRYIPGIDMKEMTTLANIVREYDGIVAAHVRDDADNAIPALAEFLAVGLETGARLQVSHIGSIAGYGKMQEALSMMDAAAARGVEIMSDCYPYNAFCTSIGSATFDGNFIARYGGDITKIEITDGAEKGPVKSMAAFEEIRRENPQYLAVAHVMREEEIALALAHPRVLLGSDGVLENGAGHPRAAGAFPKFLKEAIAKGSGAALYAAIEKMTWGTAKWLNLPKGKLSQGWAADITVFSPEEVKDNATFSQPLLPAEGFRYVLVGGKPAVENDRIVAGNLGRIIRKVYLPK